MYATVLVDGMPARCAVYYSKDNPLEFLESSLHHEKMIADIRQMVELSKF